MHLENSPGDQEFAKWLLEVGNGEHTGPDNSITLPPHMKCGNSIADLLAAIYPGIGSPQPDDYFAQRAILTARNTEVQEINIDLLNRFPGDVHNYQSADSVRQEPGTNGEDFLNDAYQPEYLATLAASGIPLSNLQLKHGAPVMLMRNLDSANGLCNGTKAVVIAMKPQVVQVCHISIIVFGL